MRLFSFFGNIALSPSFAHILGQSLLFEFQVWNASWSQAGQGRKVKKFFLKKTVAFTPNRWYF
ncbi:hypothetical protein SD71_07920 [Cohnella kolymensis]|uniref:Uncharacterized protein n=1 Tax=Cohnella kolymensis TaxID=1590652 RepID=A0ABR5A6Y0_9BACL|nr:hypothetical protein SD71_07920 [Cohnella kolymensis]